MTRRIFYFDLLERVLWTAVQGFCAVWIVTGDLDAVTLKAAAVGGGIAAAKALIATRIGDPASAATLPSPPDGTVPDKPNRPLRADRGHGDQVVVVVVILLIVALALLVL